MEYIDDVSHRMELLVGGCMNRKERKKIAKRMKLVVIVLVVVFLGVSLFFNVTMNNYLYEDTVDDLTAESTIVAERINTYFTKYAEIVHQMAIDDQLLTYVSDVKSHNDKVNHDSYNHVMNTLQGIKDGDTQISLVWLGLDRINDITSNDFKWKIDSDYNINSRPWHIEMLETKKDIVFTSPYIDTGTGQRIVSIVAPIYENGLIIGNVGIDIKMADIEAYVNDYDFGNSGYVYLMSDKETFIVEPNSYRELSDVNQKVVADLWNESSSHSFEGIDGKRFIAYSKVSVNDWMVASSILVSETTNVINVFRVLSAFIVLASVIIIIIFEIIIRFTSDYDELNKTYMILKEKDNALTQKNIAITSALEQLSLSEEELRAQYDEIQNFSTKIKELNQKYNLIIELTDSAFWEYDKDTHQVEFTNGHFVINGQRITDNHATKIIDEYVHADDVLALRESLHRLISYKDTEVYNQFRIKTGDDEYRWSLIHGRMLEDSQLASGLLIDISKLKEQEEYIKELAFTDPLTGIPNRRSFLENLEISLKKDESGTVVILDLDNFKEINDTLGHVYGDKVLKEVAQKINEMNDTSTFVSRFGGDEFLIQLTDIDDHENASEFIVALMSSFSQGINVDGEDIYLGMSIGASIYPHDSKNVNELIMNADMAMYAVKDSGKNSYQFFNNAMMRDLQEKAKIEKKLRTELANGGFHVVYQPQYTSDGLRVIGYEALLRMTDGTMHPGDFISVAEESTLIYDLGRMVTEKVIIQVSKWQTNGFDVQPVAINFSPKQLRDDGYIAFLASLLREYKVDARLIELEITENVLLENQMDTLAFLNKLSDMGITLALDDFGTGFSSINYLSYLPVSKVKLDKSLSDKFMNGEDVSVIGSIITLAHQLGLVVIAEGIEKKEQAHYLNTLKCDAIQGYYFAKPLLPENIF